MLGLLSCLITGLEYCHKEANVIYRDINPENILIDEEGVTKLSDFGVSHLMEENKTKMLSTTAGSHFYLSPEAITKDTFNGGPSDIWKCGITLYYMIKGNLPFESSSTPSLYKLFSTTEPCYDGFVRI